VKTITITQWGRLQDKTTDNMKHSLEWFKAHVSQRVYRDKNECDSCETCDQVTKEGAVIQDDLHAEYLFNIQEDLDIHYYDNR